MKKPKSETEKEIEDFFGKIRSKTPKEVRKIKKLAMKQNIKLGEERKKICRKCDSPYKNSKIRIKNGIKSVICINCGQVSRWRIK
jgi:RNase P subunit RPR2